MQPHTIGTTKRHNFKTFWIHSCAILGKW